MKLLMIFFITLCSVSTALATETSGELFQFLKAGDTSANTLGNVTFRSDPNLPTIHCVADTSNLTPDEYKETFYNYPENSGGMLSAALVLKGISSASLSDDPKYPIKINALWSVYIGMYELTLRTHTNQVLKYNFLVSSSGMCSVDFDELKKKDSRIQRN